MNRATPADHPPLFVVLLLLLVWAPLPLGSNRAWGVGLLCLGVAVLLALTWLQFVRAGRSPLAYVRPAGIPALALLGYAALVAVQRFAGPWPEGLSPLFGSADRHQSLVYLAAWASHAGVFLLVLLLADDAARVRLVLLTIVGAALAQALLSIVLFSTKAQYQFFWQDISHGARTIGTYVNHNHLAAYLYFGLSLGVGLLVGSIEEDAPRARRLRDHAVTAMNFVMSARMLLRLALLVMVVALVLTRSRMGNAAFFTALLALGVLVAVTRPALRKRAVLLVLSLALVDVLVLGQWVGLDRLVSRIEGTELTRAAGGLEESVEARSEPARRTLSMIGQRPWFGYGGGSYYTAFPPFKSPGMWLYFDHAHNDYAEIAADTGLVGLGLLGVAVLATLWRIRSLLVAPGQTAQTRGVAYGVTMVIVCVLMHSWVDFNLQIPANAFTFVAILALPWAAPLRRMQRASDKRRLSTAST